MLHLAFAVCCAVWGSTFLAIRIGNDALPPIWAATLRLVVASLVLGALVVAAGHRFPRGAALGAAAGYGALSFGGALPLLYWGETAVPSGIAAVLHATIPLTTALLARAVGLEKLTPAKIGAALLAIAGVAVIFSGELGAHVPALPLLAVVGATLSSTVGGIVLKRGPRQSPLASNAVGAAVGAPICLAASALAGESHALPLSAPALGPVLYLALMGSVLAFGLYAWLLNHWEITRVSYIAVVVPVLAVALGSAVGGERLTPLSLAGALIVLAAVVAGQRAR